MSSRDSTMLNPDSSVNLLTKHKSRGRIASISSIPIFNLTSNEELDDQQRLQNLLSGVSKGNIYKIIFLIVLIFLKLVKRNLIGDHLTNNYFQIT